MPMTIYLVGKEKIPLADEDVTKEGGGWLIMEIGVETMG